MQHNELGETNGQGMKSPMLTDQERARIIDEWPAKYIVEYYRNVVGSDVNYKGYKRFTQCGWVSLK